MVYDQQIIAKIQPQCDEFCQKVKEAKKAQGKTNQEIADATGIPISNISKFFSGNLSNPCIYNAAAVCIYLGMSIDEAFGLKQSEDDYSARRIAELEAEVHDLKIHLDYALKDNMNINEALKSRKMIIASLLGICIVMISAFGFGVIYDSTLTDVGFIQGNNVAPVSIVCITAIVIAIAVTVSIIGGYIFKKEKG